MLAFGVLLIALGVAAIIHYRERLMRIEFLRPCLMKFNTCIDCCTSKSNSASNFLLDVELEDTACFQRLPDEYMYNANQRSQYPLDDY